jgi:regulator of protease activity HflC (stomatin/prohibitin superfamily)
MEACSRRSAHLHPFLVLAGPFDGCSGRGQTDPYFSSTLQRQTFYFRFVPGVAEYFPKLPPDTNTAYAVLSTNETGVPRRNTLSFAGARTGICPMISSFFNGIPLLIYAIPVILLFLVILAGSTIKILREYERAVVFTLGRFQRVKGPGLVLLFPFAQEMVRVDLRIQVVEIPSQDVISHDNVSMKVDAVLYFNVVNPEHAIIQVQDYRPATNMLAQTTLRSVLGQHDLDEMLSERKKLSTDIQAILDSQTETWGIKVSNVEIRTVELTDNMVRAIAKQAEAERDRRAKIIHAEAEFQASQTLVNAAKILGSIPAAMQLRYLQTLTEIGGEQNSTIVFPMPIDIIRPFLDILEKADKGVRPNGALNGASATDAHLAA